MRYFKELPYRRLLPLSVLNAAIGFLLAMAGLGVAGFYVSTLAMSPFVVRAMDIPGRLDDRR